MKFIGWHWLTFFMQMFLGSRARQTRKAGNLTAICDPIV
jgi:hypothetical protein